jgi:hypothetical protein
LVGQVQFGGGDKRAADPCSGDHLDQLDVRRDGLRRDMIDVCHRQQPWSVRQVTDNWLMQMTD